MNWTPHNVTHSKPSGLLGNPLHNLISPSPTLSQTLLQQRPSHSLGIKARRARPRPTAQSHQVPPVYGNFRFVKMPSCQNIDSFPSILVSLRCCRICQQIWKRWKGVGQWYFRAHWMSFHYSSYLYRRAVFLSIVSAGDRSRCSLFIVQFY